MMSAATIGIMEHELVHILLTSLVAFFVWWRFRNWRLIIITFLIGIFIDIDHWFDYFAYFGFKISLSNFFNVASYVIPAGKIYVLLHGWEFILIFWLVGLFLEKKFKIKGLSLTILFSYLIHLLWDNFSFSHHPLAYSIIYRLLNNFSLKSFHGI